MNCGGGSQEPMHPFTAVQQRQAGEPLRGIASGEERQWEGLTGGACPSLLSPAPPLFMNSLVVLLVP